jgi:glycosyltransferase involved in cell wall biosynthesis
MDPERFETLLVHGRLSPGEASMEYLADAEGAARMFLPSLSASLSPATDARALAAVAKAIRDFRPDLIHTHTAKAGFVGRAAALAGRRRPALVHTFHGHVLRGYFGPGRTRLFRSLERQLARRTDRLIGVSEATVADLVGMGIAPRDRFQVIPLGIDLGRYERLTPGEGSELRRQLGLSEAETLAVFVGRLVPIKRLDVLLRAVARAREEHFGLHLAIVGDGELRPGLEHQAVELGIREAVHFLGYRRDLAPVFAAADLVALSSDNEGTPVSLIEGGAAGLPAVATDVGGVGEVVTAETGYLVPPSSDRRFADGLAALAGDPATRSRLGQAARESMVSRYSAERLVADVSRLYESLVAPADRARGG